MISNLFPNSELQTPINKLIYSSKVIIKKDINKYLDILKDYEYLEDLKILDNVENDLDLSNFNKLKNLHINVTSNIKVILPNSIESLYIEDLVYEDSNNIIKLENYENLKNLSCNGVMIDLDFEKLYNLEKIVLMYTNEDNIVKNINLSNSKNLYYVNIIYRDIEIINFEGCKNLSCIDITNHNSTKIILPSFPKDESKLKIISLIEYDESKDSKQNLEIINLYDNVNIESLTIAYKLKENINYNYFKKLTYLELTGIKLDILDIYQLTNLKKITISNSELSYIDFPYNFNEKNIKYISGNKFSKQKVISRRRVYLLKEGILTDLNENKEIILNDIRKCFKCKKNISLYNKINIRTKKYIDVEEEHKYNYISCC